MEGFGGQSGSPQEGLGSGVPPPHLTWEWYRERSLAEDVCLPKESIRGAVQKDDQKLSRIKSRGGWFPFGPGFMKPPFSRQDPKKAPALGRAQRGRKKKATLKKKIIKKQLSRKTKGPEHPRNVRAHLKLPDRHFSTSKAGKVPPRWRVSNLARAERGHGST